MASPSTSFNICHNPLATYSGGFISYIYNESKPRFTAALFRADGEKDVEIDFNGLNYPFVYIRGDKQQQIFLLIIWDMIDRSTTSKLLDLLQKAATWYVTCLNKTDEKLYGRGSWSTLNDYHFSMPGIQVLQIEKSGAFLLFYSGGVRTFKSEEEVSKFLEDKLNYPDQGGLEVKINVHR